MSNDVTYDARTGMGEPHGLELMRENTQTLSQHAFKLQVKGQLNLIHSRAARVLHNAQSANPDTNAVFIVLARKADRLRPGTLLSAWLLGVTRFAARDHLKAARRRQKHEHAAALQRTAQMATAQDNIPMTPTHQQGDSPHDQAGGRGRAPDGQLGDSALARPVASPAANLDGLLDDALASLSKPARDALVLRFFDGNSFKEVGQRLGITETAAKQRVFRALERLRGLLGRRGYATAGEALAVTLAATAILSAPVGFSASAVA